MNFKNDLENLKAKYNRRKGEYDKVLKDKQANEAKLTAYKSQLIDWESERIILQKISETARERARTRLESTMTSALQYTFGPEFSAEIEMGASAGKPVADVYIVTDYGNGNIIRTKPQDSRGGGIIDIISIALRIAMIQLHSDPPINGPIILDEPGKHVSADYSIKLAEFLKFISTQFKKQIIFVTHNEDLKAIADLAYDVTLIDGVTVVTKVDKKGGAPNVQVLQQGL